MSSDRLVCPKCFTEYHSEFNIRPRGRQIGGTTFKGLCKKCSTVLKFKINHFNPDNGLLIRDVISFMINGKEYEGLIFEYILNILLRIKFLKIILKLSWKSIFVYYDVE